MRRLSILAVTGAIGILGFGLWSWLSRGPDWTLTFDRTVPTEQAPEELAYMVSHVKEWPTWFHNLARAELSDGSDLAHAGALVTLHMDPHKGAAKRFEIHARITEFTPSKSIAFQVLDESKGRIAKLFSSLDWKIEINGEKSGTLLIVGHEEAQTSSARARFLGRAAPRILLNQLFYPDLIVLAEPSNLRPQSVDLVGPQ